jgi:branched-chain amino acid transport system permease protein
LELLSTWQSVVFAGLSLGSFYALIALGFSLILGITRAFNLAHGEMILLSGYLAFMLWRYLHLPFFWILLVCSLALMWLTLPLHYLLRRLPEPPGLNTLMVTLGLALVLQNLFLSWFSADYRLMKPDWPGITIPGLNLSFPARQGLLIILALLATGTVHLVLQHTFLGKALRATIQDRDAAQVAGINVHRMALVAFGLGGLLTGLAGPLFAQNLYLYPAAGAEATMIAIVVTIFAGLGRTGAILLGGWLLGLAQSAAVFTLGSKWRELVSAALLIMLLYFRPEGIALKKEHGN